MDVGAGDGIPTFDLRIEFADAESGSLKLTQLIRPKWSKDDIKLKVGGLPWIPTKRMCGTSRGYDVIILYIKCKVSILSVCGQRFTGGITNTLMGCWHKDDPAQEEMILIRIYGANTELIIDRNAEMRNIQLLHAVGCSKPLFARFANGVAYGFFPGACLDEKTVRDPVINRSVTSKCLVFIVLSPLSSIPEPTSFTVTFIVIASV